jgi:branched-chain amino acid transport system ATP-binding protein
MTVLCAEGLCKDFGGVRAVDRASLAVEAGELLGLIGPNGAGKTTLINLVTGVFRPDRGRVLLDGKDVTRLGTDRRVRSGLVRTHQIVRPFRGMSVLDNVTLAAGMARTRSPLRSLFEFRRRAEQDRAAGILKMLGLDAVLHRDPAELPLGQLKRLEVARALATDPRILLLDEPLAGLNQREASALAETIVALNKKGLTIVLVEHNLAEVLNVSTRLAVLDRGTIIAEGPSESVINLEAVRNAYIGEKAAAHA